jgi:hypothetical protein
MALAIYRSDGDAFAHFYFIIIIMSIIGLSNIIDNIFIRFAAVPDWSKLIGIVGAFLFIMVLVIGLLHYTGIKPGPHSDLALFANDYQTILIVLAVGVFVEVVIALSR